jgi:DNA helicase-2/ATP-dependent DNA helicase PcrA
MFAWGPDELNTEQGDAVVAPGNVLLMACPGSGKTRTLTYKVAYELDRIGDGQQKVAAITYTHRAADEITERIENLGVTADQLWIGTIHSFCLEWIIRPYGIYHAHLANGYRILDTHEREEILTALCAPYAHLRVSHFDCEFYFADHELVAACRDHNKRDAVLEILGEYRAHLQENRLLDFEFMLLYAVELIEDHPKIAAILATIFPFIAIDEYQDTKGIQYEIIASIIRAGRGNTKAFIVGDPNQGIYHSLGGYPILLDDLRQITGQPFLLMELVRNYRSSARIVDFFSNFRLEASRIDACSSLRDFNSRITYDQNLLKENLQGELIRLIRSSIQSGISAREVCVIAPQWVHLASVTRFLAASLPEYKFDGPGMVPFAKDPLNVWFKVSRIALTSAAPGMYVRRMRWAADVLHDFHHAGGHTEALSPALLLKVSNGITINETEGLPYLRTFFEELCLKFRIDFRSLAKLASDFEAFFSSSEARIERLLREGAQFMSDVDSFRRVFQARSGITVSTIHGVKGAEFDVVIAYALLEGMVPHFNDPNPLESATRLLYVIGSRARKHLHLLSERGRVRWRNGPEYDSTEVLRDCAFRYDTG